MACCIPAHLQCTLALRSLYGMFRKRIRQNWLEGSSRPQPFYPCRRTYNGQFFCMDELALGCVVLNCCLSSVAAAVGGGGPGTGRRRKGATGTSWRREGTSCWRDWDPGARAVVALLQTGLIGPGQSRPRAQGRIGGGGRPLNLSSPFHTTVRHQTPKNSCPAISVLKSVRTRRRHQPHRLL